MFYLLGLILLVISWEFSGQTNNTVRLLISSPSIIVSYLTNNFSSLIFATGITFFEAFSGLIIATVFSFFMMIICFFFPKFLDFIMPLMITSQVIPLVVLAPFFIILFGIGYSSKIAMAAVISFFPVFVNFATGVKTLPKNILELAHVYNASTIFKIRSIYFPLCLPNIIAGLKISSTLSVIGAIVAEFTGAKIGIGKNLFLSAIRLEPDLMMASLLLSTLIGFTMYGVIIFLENRIGKWYLN